MGFWNTLWPILVAILMLCLFIVLHEAGHFWMGRLFKFRIDEFSVGFGKKLFSRRAKSNTEFSLRLIPLGGFCKFRGEDEERDEPDAFNRQKAWKRLLVLLAGAAMNILTAFLLAWAILFSFGNPLYSVLSINEASPAENAKLQEGDIILAVDGQDAYYYNLGKLLVKADPAGVNLRLQRDKETIELFVPDLYNAEAGQNMLGILRGPSGITQKLSLGTSLMRAGDFMASTVGDMLGGLASVFSKPAEITQSLTGPVGTVQIMGESIHSGLENTLLIAMFISLNLGVFNLLPIPALDGGRIVFTLFEMVFRKPVPRNVEGWIHFAGFALLIMLMIIVTFSDLARIAGGA